MMKINTLQDYAWSFTISLLLVILYMWYLHRRKIFSIFKELGIPGPEPNIIFGNYWQMAKKNPLEFHKECIKKYGKVFGYYFGADPTLVVADLEILKQILVKDFHKFANRPQPFKTSRKPNEEEPFQSQLSNLRDKKWKEIRSIITPSFTANKMKLMIPTMNGAIDSLMKILDKQAETGESFDIYKLYQGLTMDVIGRTAFGIQTDVQNNPDDIILKASKTIFSGDFDNYFVACFVSFPELGPLWGQLNNLILYLRNEGRNPITDLMEHTTSILKHRRSDSKNRRQDLLQLMMEAKIKESDLNKISDEDLTAGEKANEDLEHKNEEHDSTKQFRQMTDHQIADNSVLFFLAGYETTSTTLAFMTYFLLKNPDVQEKIREEIQDIVESGGKLDYNSVQQMKYLEQVMMETLRMFPPIYLFVNRQASEDFEYGNYKIRKGISIQAPVYYLNHDPDIWENPEEFMPERFAPENKSKVNLLAFQSFGAGPRNCVGIRFAQLEIKLAMTRILQKYRFVPSEKTEIDSLKLRISPATMTPFAGIHLKIVPL